MPRRRSLRSALLTLAAGVVSAGSVTAQVPVEGEVLDEMTGLPVRGAIVQFPDLALATLTDSMGYFRFEAVPRGEQIMSTYHVAYEAMAGVAPVVEGDVLVFRLTPSPIAISGVDVGVESATEEEIRRTGRGSDYISSEEIADQARRTNQLLEVMRAKAPPRLNIQQSGGQGGVRFCIQSTRVRPSVQELRDLGNGCVPVMLVMDGVVVYAPPRDGTFRGLQAPNLPQDVAWMLLNQDPNEIESIRVLTGTDAFFRYGEDGRLGAVEIVTRRPERIR